MVIKPSTCLRNEYNDIAEFCKTENQPVFLTKNGFRMVITEKYLMLYKVFEKEKKIIFYRVLNGKINYPSLMHRLYKDE